jgi:hypothetical protein
VVERVKDGLWVTRMAVPLRDTEEENLLCIDFIHEGRPAEKTTCYVSGDFFRMNTREAAGDDGALK